MAHRLTVQFSLPDPRAQQYLSRLQERFPDQDLQAAAVSQGYTINDTLSPAERAAIADTLTHTTIEHSAWDHIVAPERFSFAIEIGFLPGVTDNVGATAQQMITDATGKTVTVYSSSFIFLTGKLSPAAVEKMSLELYNPLIEHARIISYQAIKQNQVDLYIPEVSLPPKTSVNEVSLEGSDDELVRLGREGIPNADGTRRGPLALSLPELHAIRDYFRRQKRNPTDIELESLAQTWSEHCKHTIFNDPLDDIKEGLFRRYIRAATETIRHRQGKKDFCVSVFTDNSGAIAFDDTYLVTHKVETHNSPSALDPFGGAVTGVVGVNRDTLGFGLGAKPIANIYGFCVGEPHDTRPLFRDQSGQQPLLAPRRILAGVVRGINTGGNQSGIPTPLGFVYTHPSFRGKPLVFAGTVGLIPRRAGQRQLHIKHARAGDYIVTIGGRVGLDGIHGATFSSEALGSGSPATAVQIGDPITQKKFSDALIREARDAGLYRSITDNGAGGISCSIAEMARECGGCMVHLDRVPLKYPGLAPWQIWISESQERMTLAVPPRQWPKLQQLLKKYDVEATRLGVFTRRPRCIVKYQGRTVMNVDMNFLHNGRPPQQQQSQPPSSIAPAPTRRSRTRNLTKDALALLRRPNIGSIAFISQQYDHEVQGTSVTKPLQGRGRVNADATILQPRRDSQRGIVLAHGYYPAYAAHDAYAMAAAALDTAVRNTVSGGGSLKNLALLDNFCWSSAKDPHRLYELKEAARACYDGAVAYNTPFISGKDSMFNDFKGYTEEGTPIHIAALPTVLISAIGIVDNVAKALTLDLKRAGNHLYLLGETHAELAGSEYAAFLESTGDQRYLNAPVPRVDFARNRQTYYALAQANRSNLIASSASISRGGLFITLAKMAIAGQLGASVRLSLPGEATEPTAHLFSESQGRMIVEVTPSNKRPFEHILKRKKIAFSHIGQVTNHPSLQLLNEAGRPLLRPLTLSQMTTAYHSAFPAL